MKSPISAKLVISGSRSSVCLCESPINAAFMKTFPEAKLARSEKEILEDKSIQMVLSASIPDERAPLYPPALCEAAASLLQARGFEKLVNVVGGTAAWTGAGYPTES